MVENSTGDLMRLILGLSAGVRYKVSLYAVTSAGVSEPSSRLVYSREQSKRHTHPPTIRVHIL